MRFILTSILIMLQFLLFSQKEISWSYAYNRGSKSLEIKAVLADGWHLYSSKRKTEGGPIQTEFEFDKNASVAFNGEMIEPEPILEFDPNFDMDVKFFRQSVVFSQKIKIKRNTILKGSVLFMVCNETMCLPPVVENFEINLKK